ncbi:MAG: iron-sulfur cluster assembly protein [Alphaproteobacteria bacterium]
MVTEKDQIDDNYDHLTHPPHVVKPDGHPLWSQIEKGLREIYDPEIPVNIYELGLIYKVEIMPEENGISDVKVEMSLTSPACPVAQEMPSWVQGAILPIDGVGGCEVEIIWEPQWNPSLMAETAKMQLNMFV